MGLSPKPLGSKAQVMNQRVATSLIKAGDFNFQLNGSPASLGKQKKTWYHIKNVELKTYYKYSK